MQKISTSLRVIVLGAQEVGKSAVTVRFLTQRFIGEYSSQKDLLYCSQTNLESIPVELEILDTSRDQTDALPMEKIQWADAFVVVFSISDRPSFLVAADCLRHVHQASSPVLLLANKRDLEHARVVTTEEGKQLAQQFHCSFSEVSAAEGSESVTRAFQGLLKEAKETKGSSSPSRRKISVVTVSKIINAVFGRNSSSTITEHKKRPSLSL